MALYRNLQQPRETWHLASYLKIFSSMYSATGLTWQLMGLWTLPRQAFPVISPWFHPVFFALCRVFELGFPPGAVGCLSLFLVHGKRKQNVLCPSVRFLLGGRAPFVCRSGFARCGVFVLLFSGAFVWRECGRRLCCGSACCCCTGVLAPLFGAQLGFPLVHVMSWHAMFFDSSTSLPCFHGQGVCACGIQNAGLHQDTSQWRWYWD